MARILVIFFRQKIALDFRAKSGLFLAVRGGPKRAFVAKIFIDFFLATNRYSLRDIIYLDDEGVEFLLTQYESLLEHEQAVELKRQRR